MHLDAPSGIQILRQAHEQQMMACLGDAETVVELAQTIISETGAEQTEAFGGTRLNQCRHQQAVEQTARLAHLLQQLLGVGIAAIPTQMQSTTMQQSDNLLKVTQLLLGQLTHRPHQVIVLGVGTEQSHGCGRGLLLAVGVVVQHRVEIGQGDTEPAAVRGTQQRPRGYAIRCRRMGRMFLADRLANRRHCIRWCTGFHWVTLQHFLPRAFPRHTIDDTDGPMVDAAPTVTRFAPSTTGRAHPGTLISALFVWLWARSRGARLILRLEDLDPQRSSPKLVHHMREDLRWFGLDWDAEELQSSAAARQRHTDALVHLMHAGHLYHCACSRAQLRRRCARAADGSFIYDGHCRQAAPATTIVPRAEHCLRCALSPTGSEAVPTSDPVVVRRDGAVAYSLATVVDDGAAAVTDIIRGRDLQATTAAQVALQRLLGLPQPRYAHHLLLLERSAEKMAKCHGSIGLAQLKRVYEPADLCHALCQISGLYETLQPSRPTPLTPKALLAAAKPGLLRAYNFSGIDVLIGVHPSSGKLESLPSGSE